jgi:hypothetical protein
MRAIGWIGRDDAEVNFLLKYVESKILPVNYGRRVWGLTVELSTI